MALSEEHVRIRKKIKSGFNNNSRPCGVELATFATSKEFSGFEDPKVAAQAVIEYACHRPTGSAPQSYDCERKSCEVRIIFDKSYDRFVVEAGTCALLDLCLKEAWEASETDSSVYKDVVMKEGISINSRYSAGEICPHVGCSFNCGFSIDGNAGTAGECMNEKREIPEDPSFVTQEQD